MIAAEPTITDNFGNTSDASGLYKSTATNFNDIVGTPTYYFRGAVENNYVEFAGFTWRIVRINEDGTVRLIMDTGINNNATYKFTSTFTWTYMYYTNGTIKGNLETWYDTNLSTYDSYIVEGDYFCEQAKVKPSSSTYTGSATMEVSTSYKANFTCEKDGNGYGRVTSKIGLITFDELVFAGAYHTKYLSSYYLSNGSVFYTMSPAGHLTIPYLWFIAANGGFYYYYTGASEAPNATIRPVINLKADTIVTGSGLEDDPYVVNFNSYKGTYEEVEATTATRNKTCSGSGAWVLHSTDNMGTSTTWYRTYCSACPSTCPNGGNCQALSSNWNVGTSCSCSYTCGTEQYLTCDEGYTLDGNICYRYTCPNGGTPNGENCIY